MIIRTNLHAEDIVIDEGHPWESSLETLLHEIVDPTSEHFISSEYMMYRLIECTSRIIHTNNTFNCPLIFDSWSCFNSTTPGHYQYEPCPELADLGFDPSRRAEKYCDQEGEWWVPPDTNKSVITTSQEKVYHLSCRSWTNYKSCLDLDDANFHFSVNKMRLVFLWISLICLLLSIIIFLSYPSLKCLRITIHSNMFGSLALNNTFWILWYNVVLFQPEVWSQNSVWCRALHVLTTFLMMSTYSWMLCEATFLRMILVNTFLDEKRYSKSLFLVGWLLPALVLLPYILYRINYENEKCWMDTEGSSIFFLAVPVILVFALNSYFLCNVIKILQSKLQFQSNFRGSSRGPLIAMQKSARAVFILIPIFGLQFLLLPIRPGKGSSLEYPYQVVSSLSTSTQGITVSLLLCFSNHEIITNIKRSFTRYKDQLKLMITRKVNDF